MLTFKSWYRKTQGQTAASHVREGWKSKSKLVDEAPSMLLAFLSSSNKASKFTRKAPYSWPQPISSQRAHLLIPVSSRLCAFRKAQAAHSRYLAHSSLLREMQSTSQKTLHFYSFLSLSIYGIYIFWEIVMRTNYIQYIYSQFLPLILLESAHGVNNGHCPRGLFAVTGQNSCMAHREGFLYPSTIVFTFANIKSVCSD